MLPHDAVGDHADSHDYVYHRSSMIMQAFKLGIAFLAFGLVPVIVTLRQRGAIALLLGSDPRIYSFPGTAQFLHRALAKIAKMMIASIEKSGGSDSAIAKTAAELELYIAETSRRTAAVAVDADTPLMEAGFDSNAALELRNELDHATGGVLDLPDTLMFDFTTPRKLACFFCEGSFAPAGQPVQACPHLEESGEPEFAGQCMRLLRGAASPVAARHVLDCEVNAICQVPLNRWWVDVQLSESIGSRVRHGGFVEGSELFDSSCFKISPAEAAAMDPQQRLVLESGYAALHATSLHRHLLEGSVTGVFLGIQAS